MTGKTAKSETWPIGKLSLWDKNPRSIKEGRFEELKARLERQGQVKPLLVTKQGTVIGGNMRLRAMQSLGWSDVWVSVTDAETDKDIFDLALTDNEEFGYYEQEQLAELALNLGLTPLELRSYEISLGAPTTLDLVLDKFQPEVEEDEVPEVDETAEPESRLGEVYELGAHRLMCGSATEASDVMELLGEVIPDLVMTDPPYGIDIVKGDNVGGAAPTKFGTVGASKIVEASTYLKIANDDTTDTARDSYVLCQELGIKNYVIWGGNYFTDFLEPKACWVIWDKQNTGNFADVEMAWTSFDKGAKLYSYLWNGLSRQGNRDDELVSRVHPTQKPVGMQQKILNEFSKEGDVVLDLFGGSGSALIACKNTDRICYMMELEPHYCDVIRKRYANHIGEGERWQEVTPSVNQVALV